MNVLELLRGRREKKSSDAVELAKRHARGENIDADLILQSLVPAGMTDEDFATLVQLVQTRDGLRRTAAGFEAAEREVAGIQARIDREQAALTEARKRFDAAVEPLQEQLAVATGKMMDASSARNALGSDANLPQTLRDRRRTAANNLERMQYEFARINSMMQRALTDERSAVEALGGDGAADRAARDYEKGCTSGTTSKHVANLLKARSEQRRYRQPLDEATAARDAARAELAAAERACIEF